ncbi:MAG: hypothetical protein KIT84_31615 [Labilithrix sp.]|nr:hypothetical protein [Labilithrix sp.]MCW5815618.1 hypothetical protein [Labilithrix sp.]
MNTTRRQVLRSAGIFGALFLSRGLVACALPGAGEPVGGSSEALVACGDAVIGQNHGHALAVPAEDVAEGADKTYSIQGGSSHDHLVTVTAADFAELATGASVTIASTTDVGHRHPVTVTCAAKPEPKPEPDGATAATISANHGHALVVPTEDVAAAETKTYSIQGASSHPHIVTLTAEDFAQLAAGATVTTASTTDAGHAHFVKVICA